MCEGGRNCIKRKGSIPEVPTPSEGGAGIDRGVRDRGGRRITQPGGSPARGLEWI